MPGQNNKRIYLDHNATTPLAPEVRDAMFEVMEKYHGNPSSVYLEGIQARSIVDSARNSLADLMNCKAERVIFTASGSESNNIALKGIAAASENKKQHIITSSIEHPAVLKTCGWLEKKGFRVTYLNVDSSGRVRPEDLASSITEKTFIVSIMLANNETGTIQLVKELAEIAGKEGVLFHTDATQAIGKIRVDIKELGVDLLTLSGHKFYGPKGVGALFVREGISIEPLIHGGGQENGLRAGTENVPGIAGLGKAAELSHENIAGISRITALRDRLENELIKLFPKARLNGDRGQRLPNTLNIRLPGLSGESIVTALDREGISISAGSACHSGCATPSGTLMAMGLTREEALSTIRISTGAGNTDLDIDITVKAFNKIICS